MALLDTNAYKKRLLFLGLGSLFLLFLSWQLSFSKSYAVYQSNQKLEQQIAQEAQLEQEIAHYRQSLAQSEALKSKRPFSATALFEVVSSWSAAHQLQVRQLAQAQTYREGKYELQLHQISLQGNYKALLSFIYLLEQELKLGQVVHSFFELQRNRDNRETELILSLELQNIQTLDE